MQLRIMEERELLQFWYSVDDAQLHIVTQLDLDHLGGETLPHLVDFLNVELQLSPTPINQMVEQQSGQVMHILVARVLAEIKDSTHGEYPVILTSR